jgi:hypothetical protein
MFFCIVKRIQQPPVDPVRSLLGNTMRSPAFLPILVSAFALLTLAYPEARADEAGFGQAAGVYTPTSKQYDKRLPPVLPGEVVVTEEGQKMRVWSSSGPVPVNPRPTPQTYNGGMPGLILDGRGGPGAPGQWPR